MEEVVLKLTTLGLATCWLECNIKREDILEFVQLKDSDEEKNDTIVKSEEKNEESKNSKFRTAIFNKLLWLSR